MVEHQRSTAKKRATAKKLGGTPRTPLTPEDRLAAKYRLYNSTTRKQNTLLLQEATACKSCKSNFDTLALQAASDKELHLLLGSHTDSTSFAWPDLVTECKIAKTVVEALFPNQQIPSHIADDALFLTTILSSVNLRILTVPHDSLPTKILQSIKGAKIEKGYPFHPNTVLSNPGDGTTGLVVLQSESGKESDSDFVFLCSSFVRNEVTVKMGEEENKAIKQMDKGGRQGPASGYSPLPHNTTCFDPKSLSSITQSDRMVAREPNSKTTANAVSYKKRNGKRTIYKSAYRDMNMSRFSKLTKKKEALRSNCFRDLLIKEMTSRLRHQAAAKMLNLTPDEGVSSIWKNIAVAIDRCKPDSHRVKEWQEAAGIALSYWEVILLEWACSSGEMRNHEACHCHFDGNKSHFMETMWLGGKVDVKDQTACTTKVQAMKNGKLVLPVQGLVFDIRCGSDVLHLALTNTLHIADETRDRFNFSRVQGP